MKKKTELENLVLEFIARQINEDDVVGIGKKIVEAKLENTNGGFWIWDVKSDVEYYSNRFIERLGYKVSEIDYTPDFWKKTILNKYLQDAVDNAVKHIDTKGEEPYHQLVEYQMKNGEVISVLCSGRAVFKDSKLLFIIGSHKILE